MTHEDAGHYAKKHQGRQIDPALAEALGKRAENGTITCAAVHAAAAEFKVPPVEAGIQADLLELRLVRCSLGLFGYGDEKNKVTPLEHVPEALARRLDAAAPEGRISCLDCWTLAGEMNLKKKEVAAACEARGLKIKPCQLGAF
jgi:hypothetical protein